MGTMLFRMDQPVDLVREAVYNLPVELFESSTTTFFDPAMGKGDYLVMVATRLKEHGHSKENILSRLYGFETNQLYVNRCLNKTPLRGAHIDVKTYEEILEWKPEMKFDVCVMNPPFNDEVSTAKTTEDSSHRHRATKLHVHFVEHALSLAANVMVICPIQGWFLSGSSLMDSIRSSKKLAMVDIKTADTAEKLFNATTGVLGVLYLTETPNEETQVYVNGTHVLTQSPSDPINVGTSPAATSVLRKLSAYPSINRRLSVSRGLPRHAAQKAYTPTGSVEFVEIIGPRDEPLVLTRGTQDLADSSSPLYLTDSKQYTADSYIDEYRIGINQNGAPHVLSVMKIIPPFVVTSYSVNTLRVSQTKVHAENALAYLKSKIVRFIVDQTHFGKGNNKQTFRHVPDLDFSRSWTDEDLYKHFNLTQEEIDLIEETVK